MNLFDSDLGGDREWSRVGDSYAVTRKPGRLDIASLTAVPFAAMDAIPQGGEYAPEFTMKTPSDIASGTYFERGDILVGKITPSFENGKQALIRELSAPFGYATTEVIPLHSLSEHHDPRFLFFYLLHPDVRHFVSGRMEGATGRQRVPESVLLELPIPRFQHEEQVKIARALEIVKKASVADLMCARTAQDLKRAAMHELFTRGMRGEKRKETSIGPVPESWTIGRLGQFACFQRGFDITKTEQVDGTIPVVSSGGVRSFHNAAAAKGPGVIVGRKGSIGTLYYVDGDYWPHDTTLWCSDFFGNVPKFVFYRLHAVDMKRLDSGAANPALNRNFLHDEQISWPGPDEQREIVTILDAIDGKIDVHRRKRAVLDDLFKALLHKLMTGEIRVADLDLSALDPAVKTEAVA